MSGIVAGIAAAAAIGGSAISARASGKASSAATAAANRSEDAVRLASDEARSDLFTLFPSAQQSAQQGFQGALDVFNQSLPQQQQAFTQGNVGAQQAILAGLPQIQNALLGGNVDLSQLQLFQIQQAQQAQQSPAQADNSKFGMPSDLFGKQQPHRPLQTGGIVGDPIPQNSVIAELQAAQIQRQQAQERVNLSIANNAKIEKLNQTIQAMSSTGALSGNLGALSQIQSMRDRVKALQQQAQ